MANKKLLICAAIAAGLLLTACVKKETPKEEEQDKVETAVSEPQPQKPAKFESLESVDTQEAQVQEQPQVCLLYTSPSPRDLVLSRMPSSA